MYHNRAIFWKISLHQEGTKNTKFGEEDFLFLPFVTFVSSW